MEFDKRIIYPNDNIWTPFGSTAEQEICVGLEGYFTDCYYDFEDLDNCNYATLTEIDWDSKYPFHVANEKGDVARYCFFLPARDVKSKEPKFRPFNLHEFLVQFPIGTTITFRRKNVEGSFTLTFVGYSEKDTLDICLGCIWYSFKELAEEYEYKGTTGEWLAFGVKEL